MKKWDSLKDIYGTDRLEEWCLEKQERSNATWDWSTITFTVYEIVVTPLSKK